jgi:hypothetical protein
VLDVEVLLTIALFVGSVVLALQIADAIFSILDARSVRDEDDPENLTRNRIRELVRTVAVTAALAVMIAFAVDSAGRLVWEEDRPVVGALLLFASGTVAFLVGMVAVIAVVRREHPTYARIRRDLRDRSSFTLEAGELAEFEARLARADRLRARRSRAGTVLRAIGVLTVLVLSILVIAAGVNTGDVRLVVGFAVGALVSVVAFVVAIRAGAVRLTALEAVLDAQRAEVETMLERARIPQRGQTPGLRDRVAKALTILREQQNR